MKLIVCWGTFDHPGEHPCRTAHVALKEAGYEPEVVKAYGSMMLPDAIFNRSAARSEAKRLTGSAAVPVLVTDDGEAIAPSQAIVAWAKANPKTATAPAAA